MLKKANAVINRKIAGNNEEYNNCERISPYMGESETMPTFNRCMKDEIIVKK